MIGLATRYVSIALMIVSAGAAMMQSGGANDGYLFAVLGLVRLWLAE
ncbi:MAG: hypothetical protein WA446_05045 [Steroidobacteraceae bacterium]